LAFGSSFLGLRWEWLRPAAELLLLAELVGLVVLERHQLFEPVHEAVGGMQDHIAEIRTNLSWVTEGMSASGDVTLYRNARDLIRALVQITGDAFVRDQDSPQTLRIAALSGYRITERDPLLAQEVVEWRKAIASYLLLPGSQSDSKTRWWSIRALLSVHNLEGLEFFLNFYRPLTEQMPLNLEVKFALRPLPDALLSPTLCTDHEAVIRFDDLSGSFRWGVLFRGPQYTALFVRWFEDAWARVPDSYLVYSREGLNQKAIDLITGELGGSGVASPRGPHERATQ
jgi:hypothetical protein